MEQQTNQYFVDVREPYTGKLLFRYDPVRRLIEIQRRGELTLIDLTKYERPPIKREIVNL